MKTYTFGKITLTQQALAVFVLQALVALSMLAVFRKNPKFAGGAFLGVLIFGSYATYLTNCTVVGKCENLAWFLVFINILSVLLVPMRLKMFKNSNK